jgi:peptidoglycan/LPS O-acetylase OafA/YrhL
VRDGGYQPALDGVRGVAILLVLGQHAPTRPLVDGYVGVTVFFCLSGYLITTLLVRELSSGTIDVRAFYRRRAARLYPALITVVAVTIGVLLVGRHDLGTGQVLAPAGAALTYTTSLFDWTDHVFATGDYFNYTWSLSIEEQFYVLWAVALLWAYRRDARRFAVVVGGLAGLSLALDLVLGLSRAVKYDQHEYFGSDTNALPILAGSLLAIVVANGWLPGLLRRLAPGAPVAVVLLPVVGYRNDTYRPSLVIVAGTALTLVTLVGVVRRPRSTTASLLAGRPMRWLGERSYSIYLWNVLARIAVLDLFGHTAAGDVVWIAMWIALAEASFRCVERPLRARLSRKPARSPAALAPLADVGTLGADRRVLPVARVDPGVVGQRSEEPLLDVVDQAGEPRGVLLRVADPAGEQAVAGEHVRAGIPAAPHQRDAPGGVPAQVDDVERLVADGDGVAVLDRPGDGHR